MIEEGRRVLLIGEGRAYFVRAGPGSFSTDRGQIDLGSLAALRPGDQVASHTGVRFTVLIPRPGDFFAFAQRTGAPMLPKDIGLVVAYTGMNHHDRVLDAGTGSGISAIYFGGIAASVKSYEHRDDFAKKARENIRDAGLDNVEVIEGDFLDACGEFEIVHLDLMITSRHVEHAHSLLSAGGYLATYTPYVDHAGIVLATAEELFSEVHSHECIERELTRSKNGIRPSTRICHSGYITIARK
jgi:tRNA (adenine57-N1/adenine58-N1)-methyltransferase